MSEALDDHLPPVPAPEETRRDVETPREERARPSSSPWADRLLSAAFGLLVGFTLAYLYLDKAPASFAAPTDPHAGIAGVGPGATRDIPGAGGGAPSLGAEATRVAAAREQMTLLEAEAAKTPNDAEAFVRLGNAAYDAEEWPRSIAAYERALAIRPNDPNVLTDLGVAYRNAGRHDEALRRFDAALKASPGHWQAMFNQVVVHGIDKGDVAKAREILARLRKEHPELPMLDRLDAELSSRGGAPGR